MAAVLKSPSVEVQLSGFIGKYTPEIALAIRACRKKVHAIIPRGYELVYDNYNALVSGFGPTERPSEAIFSIVVYPRWVSLFSCRQGA